MLLKQQKDFSKKYENLSNLIEKKLSLPEEIKAPVTQGKEAGTLYYTLNEKEIGSIRVLYDTTIPKATYQDYFRKTLTYFFSL